MRTRFERVKYGLLFAALFGLLFPAIAYVVEFLPEYADRRAPASDWIQVIGARILSYDEETSIAWYQWHRRAVMPLTVHVYIDLINVVGSDSQLWSVVYKDVYYQEGEYNFMNFRFENFPNLPPGEYRLLGLLCFKTERGVAKQLTFEFDPYIVEE